LYTCSATLSARCRSEVEESLGPQDTLLKLRTAPLWGLRTHHVFMQDGGSATIADAIQRHAGKAQGVLGSRRTSNCRSERHWAAVLEDHAG
jgi:hypothetical protein